MIKYKVIGMGVKNNQPLSQQELKKKNVDYLQKNIGRALLKSPHHYDHERNHIQKLVVWTSSNGEIKHLGRNPKSEDWIESRYTVYHKKNDNYAIDYIKRFSYGEKKHGGEEIVDESVEMYNASLITPKKT